MVASGGASLYLQGTEQPDRAGTAMGRFAQKGWICYIWPGIEAADGRILHDLLKRRAIKA